MSTGMTAHVRVELAAARAAMSLGELAYLAQGAGNWVYTCRAAAGDRVVVKIRGTGRGRFGAAAWAAQTAAAQGIVVPESLWHGDFVCVERLCPGISVDRLPPQMAALDRITPALHRLHHIPVRGFGRLNEGGIGEHDSIHQWLLRPPPKLDRLGWTTLMGRAREQLLEHAPLFDQVEARLVHGDLRARHIFTTENGALTGIIDWESVRGGDPLADLAGWTLQEPAVLAQSMTRHYFASGVPDAQTLTRLACYRVRIAPWLVVWHARQGNHDRAELHVRHLENDLRSLSTGNPTLLPGHGR